uniref:Signal peptidase complex subunit 1 n=1 Tax=Ixodes ricinus TaxID=34613 RepID=A0A090X921_IXORI
MDLFSGNLEPLKGGIIDFHGQMLCTMLIYGIAVAGAVAGVVAGYQFQDFGVTMKCVAGTALLALAVCAPSWPIYCRNKIKWKMAKHKD